MNGVTDGGMSAARSRLKPDSQSLTTSSLSKPFQRYHYRTRNPNRVDNEADRINQPKPIFFTEKTLITDQQNYLSITILNKTATAKNLRLSIKINQIFLYQNVIWGGPKKSKSCSRPAREVRFLAWRSACLKKHIFSDIRHNKILTFFVVYFETCK